MRRRPKGRRLFFLPGRGPGRDRGRSGARATQCPTIAAMNDRGQSLAEYVLIVALIVIVALVALTLFGTQINDILSIIADTING